MTCTRHGGSDSGSIYCKFCDAGIVEHANALAQPAPSQTGTPELLGESLPAFIKRHLREACSHWSAARGIDGNINEAECQAAAAFERRAKEGVDQLAEKAERELDELKIDFNEQLLRTTRAERELSQAKRDAERLLKDALTLVKYSGASLVDDGMAWNERAEAIQRINERAALAKREGEGNA